MGAKDWMIMYADTDIAGVLREYPPIDRPATRSLVERLHPGARLTPIADGNLNDNANPPDSELYAGVYPGLTIVASGEVAVDRPSALHQRFVDEAAGRTLYLHAMHSVVDWFAFAIWENGLLRRSLSVSPDHGVLENLGEPLEWEKTYWDGEHPVEVDEDDPPYPLVFHPLELGEEALRNLFGFNYEGWILDDDPDLEQVLLAGYRLS